MDKSPFLRRLSAYAPRKAGNPDKPRNARERLARFNARRVRPVSFYDSRMGGALHVLASRLRFWVAPRDRSKPDVLAHEVRRAEVAACEMSRRAWRARAGLRLTRGALVWSRRRAGWRSGPGLLPCEVRPAFPSCARHYLRTMRADAAPMRQA